MTPRLRLPDPRRPADHDGAPTTDTDAPKIRLRPRPEPDASISARARRALQPMPLLGAGLILIALIGYWAAYSAGTHRTPILTAARDLPAGQLLKASDLRTSELAGDQSTLDAIVPEADLRTAIGQRLATPVPSGAPLPRRALADQGAPAPALTLAVPALHALGGQLKPGDRVTVLATTGADGGQATARAIARDLPVLTVGDPGSAVDAGATVAVTVELPDPALATRLALANNAGKIDLLREGASGKDAAIPSATTENDAP